MSPHIHEVDSQCLAGIEFDQIRQAHGLSHFKTVHVKKVINAPRQTLGNRAVTLITDSLRAGQDMLDIEVSSDQYIQPNTSIILRLYEWEDGTTHWTVYRDSLPDRLH